MPTDDDAQPVKPQSRAANEGVDIELSEEALASLASYFDVLIQMDLEQQSNEGVSDEQEGQVNERHDEGV